MRDHQQELTIAATPNPRLLGRSTAQTRFAVVTLCRAQGGSRSILNSCVLSYCGTSGHSTPNKSTTYRYVGIECPDLPVGAYVRKIQNSLKYNATRIAQTMHLQYFPMDSDTGVSADVAKATAISNSGFETEPLGCEIEFEDND